MSTYAKRGNVTREAGWIEVTDPSGRVFRGGMRHCAHCGGQFAAPSSEKLVTQFVTPEQAKQLQLQQKVIRGWCYNCAGWICGPQCAECIPAERQLEILEDDDPVAAFSRLCVNVSHEPPRSAGGILLGTR